MSKSDRLSRLKTEVKGALDRIQASKVAGASATGSFNPLVFLSGLNVLSSVVVLVVVALTARGARTSVSGSPAQMERGCGSAEGGEGSSR